METSNKIKTKGKARVVWVDLWRFVAALAIMVFHFPLSEGVRVYRGGLFVEFFFLLSGYFAIAYMRRNGDKPRAIQNYMKKMFFKLLPFVIAGVILVYVRHIAMLFPDTIAISKLLARFPFEIALLQCTGLYSSKIYVLWYLSILMLCLPVVMYAYKKLPGVWPYLAFVVPLLLYGYLIHVNGTVRVNDIYVNVFVRGFGGLMLGAAAMAVSDGIRAMDKRKVHVMALTIVELLCLAVFLYMVTRASLSKTPLDAFAVLLMFCSFAIALSGTTLTNKWKSSSLGTWFANMSLAVYCLHWGVLKMVSYIGVWQGDQGVLAGYIITMGLSALMVYAVDKVKSIRSSSRKTA